MSIHADLLGAELERCRKECSDIIRELGLLTADDPNVTGRFFELAQRHLVAGDRLIRTSRALTGAQCGTA